MPSCDLDLGRLVALRTAESGLLRLKWLAAATRFELALRRHDRALKLAYKYGYNPAQPRVPKGNPDGGEWTAVDANGNPLRPNSPRRVRLAGEIPDGNLPDLPTKRPLTSPERVATYKTAARWLTRYGGSVGKLIEAFEWLRDQSPLIKAYGDPPKSLEELQRDVSAPGLGYDRHHIAEQTAAAKDGFARELIDAPENLVLIPKMKHWEINAWYQTENPDFGGQTPREYLSGKSWDERRAVGLEALKKFGVLKP